MESDLSIITCTAFLGERMIASGALKDVVASIKDVVEESYLSAVLLFDDVTSRPIEVDFRGTKDDVLKRLPLQQGDRISAQAEATDPRRLVGRPKLGVVAGEVTLLPRHWDWLKSQPGGASVTLRKLVEKARHDGEKQDMVREARDSAYRFMTAMAGNFADYEGALRALYLGDSARFYHLIYPWPADIRDHTLRLVERVFSCGEPMCSMEARDS